MGHNRTSQRHQPRRLGAVKSRVQAESRKTKDDLHQTNRLPHFPGLLGTLAVAVAFATPNRELFNGDKRGRILCRYWHDFRHSGSRFWWRIVDGKIRSE
jgi:hypothetical protein